MRFFEGSVKSKIYKFIVINQDFLLILIQKWIPHYFQKLQHVEHWWQYSKQLWTCLSSQRLLYMYVQTYGSIKKQMFHNTPDLILCGICNNFVWYDEHLEEYIQNEIFWPWFIYLLITLYSKIQLYHKEPHLTTLGHILVYKNAMALV